MLYSSISWTIGLLKGSYELSSHDFYPRMQLAGYCQGMMGHDMESNFGGALSGKGVEELICI